MFSPTKKCVFRIILMDKMLRRREECDTYLTHVCRRHWSGENPVNRLNIGSFQPKLWLSSATVLAESSLYFIFSLGSLCSSDVYRRESDRCHILSFFSTFGFFFTFPGFHFVLMHKMFIFRYPMSG